MGTVHPPQTRVLVMRVVHDRPQRGQLDAGHRGHGARKHRVCKARSPVSAGRGRHARAPLPVTRSPPREAQRLCDPKGQRQNREEPGGGCHSERSAPRAASLRARPAAVPGRYGRVTSPARISGAFGFNILEIMPDSRKDEAD